MEIVRNVKVKQLGINMYCFNETYKRIRYNDEDFGICYFCGKPFKDNELMTLAITDKGNRCICINCAEKAKPEAELVRDFTAMGKRMEAGNGHKSET